MRTELNELEKLSDHRILCMTAADQTAVCNELHKQGYTWGGGKPLIGNHVVNYPRVLFTYAKGAPNRIGKKIVLQSGNELGITAENRIVTAAQWLRGNKRFSGVDCTIPEETA
jgi:hypothetical protein